MGKITGFKEYARETPLNESASERLQHFKEFTLPNDEGHSKKQAARCMDCGIPFCHSGCPLGNLIPDFNEAVYQGDWKGAFDLLDSTNNFPEFTGRICPAPCEGSCVLGINNDAVAIEYIEKSIIERAFEEGWVKTQSPFTKTGYKIAIIGGGPAGMACAEQLNKAGHNVTLFERNDKMGGLLRYGIPDFKLEKSVVERRIKFMEASGINMKTSINVGVDISIKELESSYDKVVLTGGSTIARDLPIEGRDLKGIHLAMDFLEQNNRRVAGEPIDSATEISINDESVLVIGGGDTGSDCIGTSNRLGAKQVIQIELLSKPPQERAEMNPWPLWPMTLRTSSSHEEGCKREWSILTKRFISSDGTNLSGVEIVKVDWAKNAEGNYELSEIEGSLEIIPCTKAFLAIGFLHPQKEGLLEQLELDLDARGNVFTNNHRTSKSNFYAAGDMRRGQSLVVWAIAEGRACAQVVDEDLMGTNSVLSNLDQGVLVV